jgi:hypothetical protein
VKKSINVFIYVLLGFCFFSTNLFAHKWPWENKVEATEGGGLAPPVMKRTSSCLQLSSPQKVPRPPLERKGSFQRGLPPLERKGSVFNWGVKALPSLSRRGSFLGGAGLKQKTTKDDEIQKDTCEEGEVYSCIFALPCDNCHRYCNNGGLYSGEKCQFAGDLEDFGSLPCDCSTPCPHKEFFCSTGGKKKGKGCKYAKLEVFTREDERPSGPSAEPEPEPDLTADLEDSVQSCFACKKRLPCQNKLRFCSDGGKFKGQECEYARQVFQGDNVFHVCDYEKFCRNKEKGPYCTSDGVLNYKTCKKKGEAVEFRAIQQLPEAGCRLLDTLRILRDITLDTEASSGAEGLSRDDLVESLASREQAAAEFAKLQEDLGRNIDEVQASITDLDIEESRGLKKLVKKLRHLPVRRIKKYDKRFEGNTFLKPQYVIPTATFVATKVAHKQLTNRRDFLSEDNGKNIAKLTEGSARLVTVFCQSLIGLKLDWLSSAFMAIWKCVTHSEFIVEKGVKNLVLYDKYEHQFKKAFIFLFRDVFKDEGVLNLPPSFSLKKDVPFLIDLIYPLYQFWYLSGSMLPQLREYLAYNFARHTIKTYLISKNNNALVVDKKTNFTEFVSTLDFLIQATRLPVVNANLTAKDKKLASEFLRRGDIAGAIDVVFDIRFGVKAVASYSIMC